MRHKDHHLHHEPVVGCIECAATEDPEKRQRYYDAVMADAIRIVTEASEQRRKRWMLYGK